MNVLCRFITSVLVLVWIAAHIWMILSSWSSSLYLGISVITLTISLSRLPFMHPGIFAILLWTCAGDGHRYIHDTNDWWDDLVKIISSTLASSDVRGDSVDALLAMSGKPTLQHAHEDLDDLVLIVSIASSWDFWWIARSSYSWLEWIVAAMSSHTCNHYQSLLVSIGMKFKWSFCSILAIVMMTLWCLLSFLSLEYQQLLGVILW